MAVTDLDSSFGTHEEKAYPGGADSTINIEKPGFKITVNPKLASKSWNLAWCYDIAPTCCGKKLVQFGTSFDTDFLQTGAYLKKVHGSERDLVTYVCKTTYVVSSCLDLFYRGNMQVYIVVSS